MNMVDIEYEKKKTLQNVEELETAENRKDIQGILELITDDFVIAFRDAKVEGKAATREWLEESAKNYISSKHVPIRVEVSSYVSHFFHHYMRLQDCILGTVHRALKSD